MKWLYGLFSFVFLIPAGIQTLAQESPDSSDIQIEIAEFQRFFKQRFPDIEFEEYNKGVNALPQYDHRRLNWELLNRVPLYEDEMTLGRDDWSTPFDNGSNFAACFANHPPANQFPYFSEGKVITIEGAINQCLVSQKEERLEFDSARMARLVAAFRELFNGSPMEIDFSDPGMQEVYERGKNFYWTKRGQNNFSCASCHINNAGNKLRGDVLSAALGQGTGFPAYRIRWALTGNNDAPQPWSVLHRRFASCNLQAGAVPLSPQSQEYIALEVYLGILNQGIPIQSPSLRQ